MIERHRVGIVLVAAHRRQLLLALAFQRPVRAVLLQVGERVWMSLPICCCSSAWVIIAPPALALLPLRSAEAEDCEAAGEDCEAADVSPPAQAGPAIRPAAATAAKR